jgi:hypothetical protein
MSQEVSDSAGNLEQHDWLRIRVYRVHHVEDSILLAQTMLQDYRK